MEIQTHTHTRGEEPCEDGGVVIRNGNSDTHTHTHTHGEKPCEDGGKRLEFCCHKSRKAKNCQQTSETRKGQGRILPQIRKKNNTLITNTLISEF